MESPPQIHIIYTEAEVLLSRCLFGSWREIQEVHATYKASLGPWSVDEVAEYLEEDCRDLSPPARIQVAAFLADGAETRALSFRGA